MMLRTSWHRALVLPLVGYFIAKSHAWFGFTNTDWSTVEPGEVVTLTWSAHKSTVSIYLEQLTYTPGNSFSATAADVDSKLSSITKQYSQSFAVTES